MLCSRQIELVSIDDDAIGSGFGTRTLIIRTTSDNKHTSAGRCSRCQNNQCECECSLSNLRCQNN